MIGLLLGMVTVVVTAIVDTDLVVDITCKDHLVKITAHTVSPFLGVMYVQPSSSLRQGQVSGICKQEGRGDTEVSLVVGAGQCGWKREGKIVRLNLYIQYDTIVQQADDHEVGVECDMDSREGGIVGEEVIAIPVKSVQRYGVGQSWISKEEEDLLDGMDNVIDGLEDKDEIKTNWIRDSDNENVMDWGEFTERKPETKIKDTEPMTRKSKLTIEINDPIEESSPALENLKYEDQLCLSPSKIILAFGVLLLILMLALFFSCIVCRREKTVIDPVYHHNHHNHHMYHKPQHGSRREYVMQLRDHQCIL